jgi:hypothetical protein
MSDGALKDLASISDIKPDDCAGLIPLCISLIYAEADEQLSKPFISWPWLAT